MPSHKIDRASAGTDAATLLAGAASGDTAAFDGLFRRYGPEAWRFAAGVSGVDSTARYAVSDGFATSVVAARDGNITHPGGFRRSLLHAARVRVAERDDPAAPGHASSTEPIAPAFASLPERSRSVLWLEHVHQLRPNRVSELLDVKPSDVAGLAQRAHHGVAVHHLSAIAAGADTSCADALRSWTRALARRQPLRERAAMRSHVTSCSACRAALTPLIDLDTYLAPLAAPLPENLLDEARSAWLIAIAPPTATGLSPFVEKILAGASATAAVVAIVGAAYWRGDSPGQTVAIAPVMHQIGGPIPTLDGPDIVLTTADDAAVTTPDQSVASSTGNPSSPEATSSRRPSPPAASAPTQGLSASNPTVNPEAGDLPANIDTTPEPVPGDSAEPTPAPAPEPAPDPEPASEPLLTVSLPLGPQTVSINIGGGDLIETGSSAASLASGTLIDTVTQLLGG